MPNINAPPNGTHPIPKPVYGPTLAGTDTHGYQFAGPWPDDPSHAADPSFGRVPGGANAAANQYADVANNWANTQSPTLDMSGVHAARGYGGQALALDQTAAQGGAPSAAGLQYGRDLGAVLNQQAAAAGGTRGGAGISGAQQAAAMQGGGMQSQAAMGSAQGRAGELAQARGVLGQQALTQQGTDVQQQMALAGLQQQQQRINQAGQLGAYGLANQAELDQLQSNSSFDAGQLGLQAQEAQASAAQQRAYIGAGAQGGSMAFAGLAMM